MNIKKLINYAKEHFYLSHLDEKSLYASIENTFARFPNQAITEDETTIIPTISSLAEEFIKDYGCRYVKTTNEVFSLDSIIDLMLPLTSTINEQFNSIAKNNTDEAFKYYRELIVNMGGIVEDPYLTNHFIDYEDPYKFVYSIAIEPYTLKNSSSRPIYINDISKLSSMFYYAPYQIVEDQTELIIDGNDIKERLLGAFNFVDSYNGMFAVNEKDHFITGRNNLPFFLLSVKEQFSNIIFPNTVFNILDYKFFTIKLTSSLKEEVVEAMLYIDNLRKVITGEQGDTSFILNKNSNVYEGYVILFESSVDDFTMSINIPLIYKPLMIMGVVGIASNFDKIISKLANPLYDHTFDIEWYLSSNQELLEYEEFIRLIIKKYPSVESKEEAITIIQKELAHYINENLLTLYPSKLKDPKDYETFINYIK